MKAVILAGGLGTRLLPLTQATNKHLLPVYDRPMIFYPIQTVVDAGITDIMVVIGGPHAGDFIRVLKNGEDFGLDKIHYAYQEGEGGIADALSKAESFVGDDTCLVILGDNLIFEDISPTVREFEAMGKGASIFVKDVEDPERFGVVEYSENGQPISIIEKPSIPPSNDAVIGLYLYDNSVFDKCSKLTSSARGELEITDINNMYLNDLELSVRRIQGTWIDCGTFDSLVKASHTLWTDKKRGPIK
tara:strand:- start:2883 stop:3620 length:738 start_codon:yes stop_codon:yes gene_type:complete